MGFWMFCHHQLGNLQVLLVQMSPKGALSLSILVDQDAARKNRCCHFELSSSCTSVVLTEMNPCLKTLPLN